ncbi:MAG: hypothetical protein J7L54_06030 [Elusimicrobia bacterium]|nr:hypothetical protein [Elusimicrobiota bacterium]
MYYITSDKKFVVENYNWETSFSNFLPGIAGKLGIPMWIYYVSRNQCVCSVGVRDKNNQIMEFLSFNRALQTVGNQGFRTFIKTNGKIIEPFRKTKNKNIAQKLIVSSYELELDETNREAGIETNIVYFPIANCGFPAFARVVRIKNISRKKKRVELMDGLPRIIPYGVDFEILKTIQRHIEGMITVDFIGGIPLFRLKQTPADVEKVGKIEGGNFLTGISRNLEIDYIVDPQIIFGDSEIYDRAWNFEEKSLEKLLKTKQIKQNKTPCAFCAAAKILAAGETAEFSSLIGQAETDNETAAIKKLISPNFLKRKREENRFLIESIKDISFTASGDAKFDEYCRQTFLDNVIRGGMPVVFDTADGKSAFYLYSRQNGDLERDYHFFVVEPEYYSQGTGHYRSVNQNRRMDGWFFPEILDLNIKTFVNLIQTDGYNPLEITQLKYSVCDKRQAKKWIRKTAKSGKAAREIANLFEKPFTPGKLLKCLEKAGIGFKNDRKTVSEVLSFCRENEIGNIHEGFWVDHWLYNLDLIDTFLMIYPDKLEEILIGKRDYYFYDNPDVVNPRREKLVLAGGKVRQYNAVSRDAEKMKLINSRKRNPKIMRTKYGKGKIYKTNLLVKLLVLVSTRIASLDPEGIGVEMEADKPGWNDSMNGLPAILGSSLCQRMELEKALKFLKNSLGKTKTDKFALYEELFVFIKKLGRLAGMRAKDKIPRFEFWDKSHSAMETYRKRTKFGINGAEKTLTKAELEKFIDNALQLIDIEKPEVAKKIFDKNGIPYTYFENIVTKYEFIRTKNGKKKTGALRLPAVKPLSFRQKPLPLFLEGAVHMMKVHPEKAARIYEAVRNSGLFDEKLKMYKVCESLENAPFEIGRVKAWGAGWIENESVYTHMEYKYLLEIVKSGLFENFYRDAETMLNHNFRAESYKRSIFENVSFIVSSAFPDDSQHGRGLQPRLSGVTGEMINIWTLLVAGKQPFYLSETGKLRFRLSPALAGNLFLAKNRKAEIFEGGKPGKIKLETGDFAFKLFGKILTIYKNSQRKNTFGKNCVKVRKYILSYVDKTVVVENEFIEKQAQDIRDGKIKKITALLW